MNATIRGHRGLILRMRFLKAPGPYCRVCGTAVVREMSAKTLLLGWWGLFSVFATPVTLVINAVQFRKIRKLPPPAPDNPRPRLDPGRPLWRRPALLGLLVPIAIIALLVIGAIASQSDPTNAKADNCVHQTGPNSVKIVACDSPDADYQVLMRVKNANSSVCDALPNVTATYTETGGTGDFELCLGAVP